MKPISKFFLFSIIFIAFLFNSCEKEDFKKTSLAEGLESIDINTIKVKSGVPVFNDDKEYMQVINIISQKSSTELDEWEERIGFNSLRNKYNNLYDKLELCTNSEQVYKFLDNYGEYFEVFVNEDGEEEAIETIPNYFIQSMSDAKGCFISGNRFYRALGANIYSVPIEEKEKLVRAKQKEIENIKDVNIQPLYSKKTSKTTVLGGERYQHYYEKDPRWCNNDRRVYIEMAVISQYTPAGQTSYTYGEYLIYGKRKYSCIWFGYKTNLTGKDLYYEFAYSVYDSGGYSTSFHRYPASGTTNISDEDSKEIRMTSLRLYQTVGATEPPTPYFIDFGGRAYSRGSDGGYATMDEAEKIN